MVETELIHMKDCYVREFNAKVLEVLENGVVLSKTAFYPRGGGVECDTGKLFFGNEGVDVEEVIWSNGKVLHVLEALPSWLKPGIEVKGAIDWERRYRLMRLHTAAHLLSALIYSKTGAKIGSNRIKPEKAYIDFTLENFDRELILSTVEEANRLIKQGREVRIYFMPREEALKDEQIVKLASKLPPDVEELRIVEIVGIDKQACGGPHVKNIKEIGEIKVLKLENKGKAHRRLYYTV